MVRRGNRKRKPRGESRSPAALVALAGALALAAFGLWRCIDEPGAGGGAPSLRAAAVRAVDVGPGKEVDPTIVDEQRLLAEEAAPPDASAPEAAVAAPGAAPIGSAGAGQGDGLAGVDAEKYPLHAVAFHFHTQILAEPRQGARVVAYARRGAKLRVGERVSTAGCKRGWHEVAGGGFLCDGQGVQVARQEVSFSPAPPAPELGSALPYDYMYAVADGVPEYWRVPTAEEVAAAERAMALAAGSGLGDGRHDEAALRAVLARASALGAGETDAGPDDRAPRPPPPPPPPPTDADAGEEDGLPAYVHQRMTKGYYVSADGSVTENGATYARTVRGRFVPADRLAPAKASTFEGALVTECSPLPIAFVVASGARSLSRKGGDGPLRELGGVSRYDRFPVVEEVAYKGQRYARIGENRYLPSRSVGVARAAAPPADLAPDERWIDVNLSEQTLVAYEGERPVFATLVSTGRAGHETPEGAFRIYGKHVTITMDDTAAGDEAYSIEDVPWTQYFKEGYALHAAFWHDRFGRVRSHGCVNLSPADARRLFFWTGPRVPGGLHGAIATRPNPGTRVLVHR